jgi:anti-anti-sigma factor
MLPSQIPGLRRNRPPDSTRLTLVALLRGSRDDVALDYYFPAGPGMSDQTCPGPRLTVKVEVTAGTITVFICGELDLVTMPALSRQLTPILAESPGRLIFDLTGTTFADIGSARLLARAGPPGGRPPVIRHPRPGVRRILELTGLDAYCEIEG